MKESLGTHYKEHTIEYFYDSLIREQDKLIHLGMISNVDTSGKSFLYQHKENSKLPKKQFFFYIQDYLSKYKILNSYVENEKLKGKTSNAFIIFFPNMDLHILFLYLHFTP